MASAEELIDVLKGRHPDDAEDLSEALQVFQKQKLHSLERLAKLSDSQWQRLGLPLGIEALLKEEVEAAAAMTDASRGAGCSAAPSPPSPARAVESTARRPQRRGLEEREEEEAAEEEEAGLYRRGGGRKRVSSEAESRQSAKAQQPQRGLLGDTELQAPPDLEELWQQLLEDTLPPDKREALQASWQATPHANDRYMMFLEYSSYLRKQEISEEEKKERRKQLEPLMKQYGLDNLDESESGGALVWIVLLGILMFITGVVYYTYSRVDAEHDVNSL
eukprot:TRINITY_DN11634_c0_g1_i1.p1 TRINITY_DN11634_c0_g1~~TRINITY_DN11634_c0_g1_i1.p1  ORF type:complete len:286 (+),score=93.75 TRINITY_DN11634_c0_g1_i1:28-858(+)